MNTSSEKPFEQSSVIGSTMSRCLTCKQPAPGKFFKKNAGDRDEVYLSRVCPEHGRQTVLVSRDARFFFPAPTADCCLGGKCLSVSGGRPVGIGKNATTDTPVAMEKLSTCFALIEIVNSCNLKCPTCFADSPFGGKQHIDAVPLTELKKRILGVLDRKGEIEILQLSGGETTLHPDLFSLLEWCANESRIRYIIINTNGVRLASDQTFARMWKTLLEKHPRKMELYLQFDGITELGQQELRGTDLRQIRTQAIQVAADIGLPITLSMVVTQHNIHNIWDTLVFGTQFPHIGGISFQPMFNSGRIGEQNDIPISVADIALALMEQSAGVVTEKTLSSLPCGHPNCSALAYLVRRDGNITPWDRHIDPLSLKDTLANTARHDASEIIECGCDTSVLGLLVKRLALKRTDFFMVYVKPFMDSRTWDEERIKRCCTHVIRPDGKLDSFCHYYSGFPDV